MNLMTRKEACKLLGVGEKTFVALGIPFYKIGKRQKYRDEDIEQFLEDNREGGKCRLAKGKARPSTGMISRLKALDFEAALKQTTSH